MEDVDQIQDEMDCLWSYRTALVMAQSHDYIALNIPKSLADASAVTSENWSLLTPNSNLGDKKSSAAESVASLSDEIRTE